jgi:DNA polymerase-3 subunit epsilon
MSERAEISLEVLDIRTTPVDRRAWPMLPVSGKRYLRSDASQARDSQPHYIATLVAKLPACSSGDPDLDDYLFILDRALEDRRITVEEASHLERTARELGLSQTQAEMAHLAYMRDLVRVAMADGVISPFEAGDLEQVRELLHISSSDYALLMGKARAGRAQGPQPTRYGKAQSIELAGKTVCFTGEFLCHIKGVAATRSEAEELASQMGMIVKKSVTKNLDYLVTADPDSMSGKAVKARKYGIRILAEPVFWQMVGVQPE